MIFFRGEEVLHSHYIYSFKVTHAKAKENNCVELFSAILLFFVIRTHQFLILVSFVAALPRRRCRTGPSQEEEEAG